MIFKKQNYIYLYRKLQILKMTLIKVFNEGLNKVSLQKRAELKYLNIFSFIIFFGLDKISINEFKLLAEVKISQINIKIIILV